MEWRVAQSAKNPSACVPFRVLLPYFPSYMGTLHVAEQHTGKQGGDSKAKLKGEESASVPCVQFWTIDREVECEYVNESNIERAAREVTKEIFSHAKLSNCLSIKTSHVRFLLTFCVIVVVLCLISPSPSTPKIPRAEDRQRLHCNCNCNCTSSARGW